MRAKEGMIRDAIISLLVITAGLVGGVAMGYAFMLLLGALAS